MTRTLAKTGTYLALVREDQNDDPVAYTITLERIRPPSPNAQPIGYGSTLSAAIDVFGDVDLFTFNGVAGDLVRVQAIDTTNFRSVCLEQSATRWVSRPTCWSRTPRRSRRRCR